MKMKTPSKTKKMEITPLEEEILRENFKSEAEKSAIALRYNNILGE